MSKFTSSTKFNPDGYYKHRATVHDFGIPDGLTRVCYYFKYKGYTYVKIMDVETELVDDPDTIKLVESIAMKDAAEKYDNMVRTL